MVSRTWLCANRKESIMTFKDQVILITGGGKGIGRATALQLAKQGAKLVITGRTEKDLIQTSQAMIQSGYVCLPIVGDVTMVEDCKRIMDETIKVYQRLDVLINNAGLSMRGLFEQTSLEVFHQVVAINFLGAVNMTKFALPFIKKNQGSIVFISSLSGLKGLPMIAPYSSAKMALTGFSESLRAELANDHVHVGNVFVGFTENDANKKILDGQGKLMAIQRPKNNASQNDVACAIQVMLQRRQSVKILTPLGKLASFAYRMFPRLTGWLIVKFALKSNMYR